MTHTRWVFFCVFPFDCRPFAGNPLARGTPARSNDSLDTAMNDQYQELSQESRVHNCVPQATLDKRKRQGFMRGTAAVAAVLGYHPLQSTPPAWAGDRMGRMGGGWAKLAAQRLGEPGVVTIEAPEAVVHFRCDGPDGAGGYMRAFDRMNEGESGQLLAEGEAALAFLPELSTPALAA